MRHALAGEETFGEFLDYRGVPVLAVTRRLATVPWGLLVKVDTDEALAPERRHVALEATMLLGALAGLAALGYVVRRQEKGALSAALQRSGAREAALLDHANDPLLFLAPDGLIREANRRAAEFYGLPRERLLGRSVFDLRSEDERSRAREEHQAVLDDGSAVHEAVHVDAAGRGRPVEVSSRLVEVGEGPTVVSIVRDIAARKDQESHILLLSRLYRTLSQVNQLIVRMPERQTLLDGVCGILSGEGGFPLAWVGLKEDDGRVEIVARDGEAAAYARDLEVRWDETPLGQGPGGRALRDGRPVVVPDVAADPGFGPWASRARKHDLGTVGVFPIPIDGKAVGVVAVYATEIGAIREDEQALLQELAGDVGLALDRLETREEHERTAAALEAFFRSDVVGILFGTVDGRILEANDALLRIIGYSRAELERGEVGWKDITPPEHLPKDDAAIAEAKERGACTPYEKEYIRKDGRRVWVLVGFALLQPERERSVAFILDVTEAREAEEESRRLNVELESRVRRRTAELEVASADLEAFSDSVSHDLRAPLRTIDGFARALEEEHEGRLDAEGRRVLSMMRENAAGMDRLIDDLLAFAQAARQKLEPTRVEMGRLAREAFEELASRHDIEGLELRVARLEAIEGDPALLKQVWSNLLSNALESTRGRSPRLIDVDSEAGSGEVRYLVRDNRVGFDLRYPGKLFDAFQRVHPPGELEGTGVGLALVRRIVSRHGGRVGAEGRPGEGALSWFSLPRPGRRL
jgi:PAS domain S-box-containing protein